MVTVYPRSARAVTRSKGSVTFARLVRLQHLGLNRKQHACVCFLPRLTPALAPPLRRRFFEETSVAERFYDCLNCGKQMRWSSSKNNKYCSFSCQHSFQRKIRIETKLVVGTVFRGGMPSWVKKHLAALRGYSCEVCGISEWNGKKLSLEVDHIDGVHYNNIIENLRLVCPNCHSQTVTYKARNKGNGPTLNKAPEA